KLRFQESFPSFDDLKNRSHRKTLRRRRGHPVNATTFPVRGVVRTDMQSPVDIDHPRQAPHCQAAVGPERREYEANPYRASFASAILPLNLRSLPDSG